MDELVASLKESCVETIDDQIEKLRHGKEAVAFTTEEMEVFSSAHWIETVFASSHFFQCLKDYPTSNEGKISKDELAQFAVIVTLISPLIAKVNYIILRNKEEEAKALGMKSQREKKKMDKK
jgi:hypothetical protein